MSNALAIAAVTAVLQYYLTSMYSAVAGSFSSTVTVSCLAPDQVQNQIEGLMPDTENQVNLFLHQVTPNPAWRNVGLASMSADGTTRLNSPPLALDLHYLLTVYGSQYWQSEALLGYALMMLQEAPVLTRADITNAMLVISPPPPPPAPPSGSFFPPTLAQPLYQYLQTSGLADQTEMIKITPESMTREELAWLWTALKADYRLTFPFKVSVVLLQPELPTSFALPVLQTVFAPPVPGQVEPVIPMQTPQVLAVQTQSGQVGASPLQTVTVTGVSLAGATRVSLSNTRYGPLPPIPVTQAQGDSLSFVLPSDSTGQYPAGVYDLVVQFMDPTNKFVQVSTNTLPLAVAPSLPATQTATTSPSGTGTMVTINSFSPVIWEGQEVILSLSLLTAPYTSVSAQAQPFVGPPNSPAAISLSFLFDEVPPSGVNLLAQLRVDGVPSAVMVAAGPPPSFSGPYVVL
jgi:hypothetical protein